MTAYVSPTVDIPEFRPSGAGGYGSPVPAATTTGLSMSPNVSGQPGLYQSPALKSSLDGAGSLAKGNLFSDKVIPGLDTLNGIFGSYLGYQALQLSQDQFDTSRAQFNANLANEAKSYNTNLRESKRAQLVTSGGYDLSNEQDKAAFEAELDAYVKANSLDGSPI